MSQVVLKTYVDDGLVPIVENYFGLLYAGQSYTKVLTDPIGNHAAHQAGVDNIEVIQWIPEPGSYALIVGLLSLASVMVRRR